MIGQGKGGRLGLLAFSNGGTQGRILGDDNFVSKVLNQAEDQSMLNISLDALTVLMAEKYNISRQSIISKARNRSAAEVRAVIALLAADHTRHTLNEVSIYLGREISTMSKQVKKLRNKITKFSAVNENKPISQA